MLWDRSQIQEGKKKKKNYRNANMWKLNNMLVKQQWETDKMKEKIPEDKWKIKAQQPKNLLKMQKN